MSTSPTLARSSPDDHAVFPVVTSLIATNHVASEIAHAYGLSARCQLIERGLNDTYLVSTATERYVARVYRLGWRSRPDVQYEVDLLLHLAAKAVSVAAPIPLCTGGFVHECPAPEGIRHLVLFTYAPGGSVKWDERYAHEAGALLARIHVAAADFHSSYGREELDLDALIDAPLDAIRPYLSHRMQDWTFLESFGARLRADAQLVVERPLARGICHGDFDAHNVHFTAERKPTVFDFDFCGRGWLSYDLVTPRWGARRPEVWDAFINGYSEVRPAHEELAALPLFQTLRHLWGMGLRARNAIYEGSSRITDAYLDYRLQSFRNWDARMKREHHVLHQ